MNELGVHNPANGVAELGLGEASRVFYNLNESELYEHAIRNGEAELTIDGALRAVTGQHTGRSPKDKFVVRDASTENTICRKISSCCVRTCWPTPPARRFTCRT